MASLIGFFYQYRTNYENYRMKTWQRVTAEADRRGMQLSGNIQNDKWDRLNEEFEDNGLFIDDDRFQTIEKIIKQENYRQKIEDLFK
ncbi:hypothetical protein RCL_jg13951.t1 [Rhizophagus clarus]|uniref:Uncharacterized protein n=1 Tax=Rhizophagus clarus TaxID=94130 RepID=A0A8H3LS48_9GLOM|nr:hypothetical protein RCL_jg13951.t1 [Rhizophagus clarus]